MSAMVLSSLVLAIAAGAGIANAAEPVPVESPAVELPVTACTYHAEPAPADTPIKKSMLTLLARQPAEGDEVRRDTVIALDLEYRIEDFAAGAVVILPYFATAGEGVSSPGSGSDYPPLEAAAGKVHLCVPLAEMYALTSLEWPITFGLSLMRSHPDGTSTTLAFVPNLQLKSADTPAEALARQAARPPIEYYDNLKRVSEFFESRLARYKACNQRFPEGQAALTKSYRRWESRHTDAVQLASELQFEFYLETAGGNAGYATRMFDAIRIETLRGYSQLPVAVLREQCANALSEFSDPEDLSDNITTDEIAYLKKWRATHQKAGTP